MTFEGVDSGHLKAFSGKRIISGFEVDIIFESFFLELIINIFSFSRFSDMNILLKKY